VDRASLVIEFGNMRQKWASLNDIPIEALLMGVKFKAFHYYI
jgi:hypothetical protein